jgi:hypothetical protein
MYAAAHDDDEITSFLPGILLDARNHIVFTVLSIEVIGVCLDRSDVIPSFEELGLAMITHTWVTVHRDGEGLYLLSPSETEGVETRCVEELRGPEANEAAQLAIEMALAYWPEWGGELRNKYKPRSVIPIYDEDQIPEA